MYNVLWATIKYSKIHIQIVEITMQIRQKSKTVQIITYNHVLNNIII